MQVRLPRPLTALGALAMAGALVAGACAPSLPFGSSRDTQGAVTIEYWDWWVSQGPTIDNEIRLFHEQHPQITIKKTTQVSDRYPELMQLAMKGRSAPDVFLIPEKPAFTDQVQEGWFLPLNDFASGAWMSGFPDGSFAEGDNIIDGKLYTAPYEGPAPWLQLYVNTKVFQAAGLTNPDGSVKLPQTWEDVRQYAAAVTKAGHGAYYGWGFGDKQKFILPWQALMVQYSGAPGGMGGFDSREGRFTWASNPVYLDWMKFFMGMKQDGSIVPIAMSMDDEMARAAFADGKFAMLIGGSWVQSGWAKTHPDFKDYTVVRLPSQDGTRQSYFYRSPGGKSWAISSTTKHPQEAWLWFQWLHSREAATRWVKDGLGLRVYPDVNQPEYAPSPQFAQFLQLQGDVRLGPAPQLAHPEMTQVKSQEVKPGIQDILEGVYTGQITDWEGALTDLEARENAELARAIKDAQGRGVNVDPSWWRVPDWDLSQDYH